MKIESEKYGDVNTVDSIVTYDEATNTAAIFLVNRSLTETHLSEIYLAGFKDITILEQATITDSNFKKSNTLATGEQVKPDKKITSSVSGNTISISLSPVSWQMVRVSLKKDWTNS
jgi:alpha-N-arabinofuranosidase